MLPFVFRETTASNGWMSFLERGGLRSTFEKLMNCAAQAPIPNYALERTDGTCFDVF